MKNMRILLGILALVAIFFFSHADFSFGVSPQPPTKTQPVAPTIKQESPKVPKTAPVKLPSDPQIRSFTATPAGIVSEDGGQVTLRWQVEPGVGASPITGVRITKTQGSALSLNIRFDQAAGQHVVNLPKGIYPGNIVYALTATNALGNTSTETVIVEVVNFSQLAEAVKVLNIQMAPPRVAADTIFSIGLWISNSTAISIPGPQLLVQAKAHPVGTSANYRLPICSAQRAGPNRGGTTVMLRDCRFPTDHRWDDIYVSLTWERPGAGLHLEGKVYPPAEETVRAYSLR